MNDWQPSAAWDTLQQRAEILRTIRNFFAERDIVEVETPLLSQCTVTDPFINSINITASDGSQRYLQTSPEYAMKRLLASGAGAIYQLCKAFRAGDIGTKHNPEFTMLEWYRPDFGYHQLMQEVDDLLQCVLGTSKADKITYTDLFQSYLAIDVHTCSVASLQGLAKQKHIEVVGSDLNNKDTWLELLFSHCIEPNLGVTNPTFIYDFPTSQAALAKIRLGKPNVAERFEVYVKGLELANGFHELTDVDEQRQRFETNNISRKAMGLEPIKIDERFLAALAHGLPDCAGVALGVDRLIMLATGKKTLSQVLSFAYQTA